MLFLRKLLVVLAFFAGVVSAAPDAKPIHTVSRSFPAAGTVHSANFFYEQIPIDGVLPAAEKPLLFLTPADEEALSAFESSASHAVVTKSAAAGIIQLASHVGKTVKSLGRDLNLMLQPIYRRRADASVKFEFSNPAKAVVVEFEFTKEDEDGAKITAQVKIYGRAEQMPQTILNLLQAVICDDSFASKHWGKGLFATALGFSFLKRRDIPVVGELFRPFHERAIAKINRLNPGMFGEFGEFACPGVQWAKLKKDHRVAVVLIGTNDPVEHLCDAAGKLNGINQLNNSALVGVECFWVITEDNIDKKKVKAFKQFVEALSAQGWAFPNEVQMHGSCGLNGVTAGMSNFFVPESTLVDGVERTFMVQLESRLRAILPDGWALENPMYHSLFRSCTYKNGRAMLFLGSGGIAVFGDAPLLSSARFHFVPGEKTIATQRLVKKTIQDSGYNISTVSQNFVVYRDYAHNQIGLMFNGKMKTFLTIESLVDCVAKKIKKMMLQTTVTKIEPTPPPAPPAPPVPPKSTSTRVSSGSSSGTSSSAGPERVLTVDEVAEIQRNAKAACDAADAAEALGDFSHLSPEYRAAAEAAWRAKASAGSAGAARSAVHAVTAVPPVGFYKNTVDRVSAVRSFNEHGVLEGKRFLQPEPFLGSACWWARAVNEPLAVIILEKPEDFPDISTMSDTDLAQLEGIYHFIFAGTEDIDFVSKLNQRNFAFPVAAVQGYTPMSADGSDGMKSFLEGLKPYSSIDISFLKKDFFGLLNTSLLTAYSDFVFQEDLIFVDTKASFKLKSQHLRRSIGYKFVCPVIPGLMNERAMLNETADPEDGLFEFWGTVQIAFYVNKAHAAKDFAKARTVVKNTKGNSVCNSLVCVFRNDRWQLVLYVDGQEIVCADVGDLVRQLTLKIGACAENIQMPEDERGIWERAANRGSASTADASKGSPARRTGESGGAGAGAASVDTHVFVPKKSAALDVHNSLISKIDIAGLCRLKAELFGSRCYRPQGTSFSVPRGNNDPFWAIYAPDCMPSDFKSGHFSSENIFDHCLDRESTLKRTVGIAIVNLSDLGTFAEFNSGADSYDLAASLLSILHAQYRDFNQDPEEETKHCVGKSFVLYVINDVADKSAEYAGVFEKLREIFEGNLELVSGSSEECAQHIFDHRLALANAG